MPRRSCKAVSWSSPQPCSRSLFRDRVTPTNVASTCHFSASSCFAIHRRHSFADSAPLPLSSSMSQEHKQPPFSVADIPNPRCCLMFSSYPARLPAWRSHNALKSPCAMSRSTRLQGTCCLRHRYALPWAVLRTSVPIRGQCSSRVSLKMQRIAYLGQWNGGGLLCG